MSFRGIPASVLGVLRTETEDFCVPSEVERIDVPTPLQFYRDYVSSNRPVIITNALTKWGALRKWTNDYLRNTMGDKLVHVAQTKDGRADSIKDDCFVKPLEEQMKMSDFLDILEGKKDSKQRVYYIQHQNGSFQKEYHELWGDVNIDDLNFATEAFGVPPDATNFWCGTVQSVTSLHKDPYENIYCVIKGYKTFTLLPPTDLLFLYQKHYKSATLKEAENQDLIMAVDDPPSNVPWISVDPDNLNLELYPRSKNIHPVRCTVGPGEILYLPSLWFHKVGQIGDNEGRNISINLWYDMKYSFNYVYYRLLEELASSDTTSDQIVDDSEEKNIDENREDEKV